MMPLVSAERLALPSARISVLTWKSQLMSVMLGIVGPPDTWGLGNGTPNETRDEN